MRLKSVLLLTLALVITYTAHTYAGDGSGKPAGLQQNRFKPVTKEDYIKAFKSVHKRVPNKFDASKLKAVPQSLVNNKSGNDNVQGLQTLPENMIFPGEFDEVKAILITWPYISIDEEGYYTEQLFENLVFYYDQENDEMYSEKVYNFIDTSVTDPFAIVYSQLAHAIDLEAEVWINIWAAEDSNAIKSFMASLDMPLQHARFFVNPGNSFWYRDCGPVAFYYGDQDSVGFIDFEYYGGRPMDDKIPVEIAKAVGYPVYTTTIEYEGGNILLDGRGRLFTSEALYTTNQDEYGPYVLVDDTTLNMILKDPLTVQQIKDSLTNLLNLDYLRILPSLQHDGGTGHIDLYADMSDENTFVFTVFPDDLKKLTDYTVSKRNIDTIMSIGRTDGKQFTRRNIPFPRKDDGSWYTNNKDYEEYTRTYSNHTFVNKTIIQPVFADETTESYNYMLADLDSLKAKYPGYNIVPIDVRSFDGSGGAIHCITKQIPADNPIRIYHNRIPELITTLTDYPVSAEITNKSGIASAKCMWRYSGTESWNEVTLNTNSGAVYSGSIPNDKTEGAIDYYITATSNNGKTIAKPLPAPDGYYTFTFSTSVGVEDEADQAGIANGEFYPNPAVESASIAVNNGGTLEIVISDILGNRVYGRTVTMDSSENIVTLNTTSLSSGSYIVTLKSGSTVSHKMLTVTK